MSCGNVVWAVNGGNNYIDGDSVDDKIHSHVGGIMWLRVERG
jgi:hypothetical protein